MNKSDVNTVTYIHFLQVSKVNPQTYFVLKHNSRKKKHLVLNILIFHSIVDLNVTLVVHQLLTQS